MEFPIYPDLPVVENLRLSQTSELKLVTAIYTAYANHLDLIISPDDVLACFSTQIASHVNKFHEHYQPYFSESGEYELITVETCTLEDAFFLFNQALDEKDVPDFCSHDFTTSQACHKLFGHVVRSYMVERWYGMRWAPVCGVRSVKLTGTLEDWKKVERKVSSFRKIAKENIHEPLDDFIANVNFFICSLSNETPAEGYSWNKMIYADGIIDYVCDSTEATRGWFLNFALSKKRSYEETDLMSDEIGYVFLIGGSQHKITLRPEIVLTEDRRLTINYEKYTVEKVPLNKTIRRIKTKEDWVTKESLKQLRESAPEDHKFYGLAKINKKIFPIYWSGGILYGETKSNLGLISVPRNLEFFHRENGPFPMREEDDLEPLL